MSSWEFAPKVTRASGSGTTVIEGGNPVRVWGIVFSHETGSNTTVDVRESGTTTVIFSVRVAANSVVVNDVMWIADKGLDIVSTSANMNVTVFHSQPGS